MIRNWALIEPEFSSVFTTPSQFVGKPITHIQAFGWGEAVGEGWEPVESFDGPIEVHHLASRLLVRRDHSAVAITHIHQEFVADLSKASRLPPITFSCGCVSAPSDIVYVKMHASAGAMVLHTHCCRVNGASRAPHTTMTDLKLSSTVTSNTFGGYHRLRHETLSPPPHTPASTPSSSSSSASSTASTRPRMMRPPWECYAKRAPFDNRRSPGGESCLLDKAVAVVTSSTRPLDGAALGEFVFPRGVPFLPAVAGDFASEGTSLGELLQTQRHWFAATGEDGTLTFWYCRYIPVFIEPSNRQPSATGCSSGARLAESKSDSVDDGSAPCSGSICTVALSALACSSSHAIPEFAFAILDRVVAGLTASFHCTCSAPYRRTLGSHVHGNLVAALSVPYPFLPVGTSGGLTPRDLLEAMLRVEVFSDEVPGLVVNLVPESTAYRLASGSAGSGRAASLSSASAASGESGDHDMPAALGSRRGSDTEVQCSAVVATDVTPHLDSICIQSTLTKLSPETLVDVFTLLMQERKLVVHGAHEMEIMHACETFRHMLFPFEWSGSYIPVCPARYLELLDAPMPFIVGVPSDYLPDSAHLPPDTFILDLDTDNLTYGLGAFNRNLRDSFDKFMILSPKAVVPPRLRQSLDPNDLRSQLLRKGSHAGHRPARAGSGMYAHDMPDEAAFVALPLAIHDFMLKRLRAIAHTCAAPAVPAEVAHGVGVGRAAPQSSLSLLLQDVSIRALGILLAGYRSHVVWLSESALSSSMRKAEATGTPSPSERARLTDGITLLMSPKGRRPPGISLLLSPPGRDRTASDSSIIDTSLLPTDLQISLHGKAAQSPGLRQTGGGTTTPAAAAMTPTHLGKEVFVFNTDDFVRCADPSYEPFLRKILQTQAFSRYVRSVACWNAVDSQLEYWLGRLWYEHGGRVVAVGYLVTKVGAASYRRVLSVACPVPMHGNRLQTYDQTCWHAMPPHLTIICSVSSAGSSLAAPRTLCYLARQWKGWVPGHEPSQLPRQWVSASPHCCYAHFVDLRLESRSQHDLCCCRHT